MRDRLGRVRERVRTASRREEMDRLEARLRTLEEACAEQAGIDALSARDLAALERAVGRAAAAAGRD